MIPADLASRLRILIDSEVKAPAPIQELLSDFPELETGQRFSATIQSPLADGTFRALVNGRNLTLSVPEGAKSGDVLELIVTGKQDKTITARLADTGGTANTAATAGQPRLSAAGQLISQLLTGRYGDTQAATLNGNEPLLAEPPIKASGLPPVLRQAVSESGLFYEAHQAQWAEGEGSLESLLREPQARFGTAIAQTLTGSPSLPAASPDTTSDSLPGTGANPQDNPDLDPAHHQTGQNNAGQLAQNHHAPGSDAAARSGTLHSGQDADTQRDATADKAQGSSTNALKISEQLMPLVHQQLETLATHQALWQGQIWPGQNMQWQIFDPEGQSHASGDQGSDSNEPPPWQSILRLKMPRLGDIEAQLIVTAAGVAIRVSADSTRTIEQLRQGGEALGSALEAAGVAMTGFVVQAGDSFETGV
ncbi:flagellar hook-length control protein FliK [Uliginosibacterium sp. H3]|uniref:Flagellar hook-length control protein FliK n=1 Tax=Uliginosibacterium silvisoli TaxID=3114758 RepID=A0ABU6K8C1_9RHOO|nr:flagellar hook-length control protein FliK [Uliginosibacterium sp. H3]